MAVAEKTLTSAETTTAVGTAVGIVFDRIQVMTDAKFHTLTIAPGHIDGGKAWANETEGSALSVPPGLYEGRWTAIKLHSGTIRVYEGF